MTQQWDFPVDEPASLPEYRRHRVADAVPVIARRIATGASIRSLAAEYEVSREAIRRALAKAGIVITVEKNSPPTMTLRRTRGHRLPSRGRSQTLTPDELTPLLTRHHAGESIRALAREAGVSHETLRRGLANGNPVERASA